MWPEPIRLGGFVFSLYGVMRVAAIVGATTVAVLLNRQQGIRARVTLGMALCCIPVSVLAAWMLDAVEYAPSLGAFGGELARRGSSIYGALLTTIALVWTFARPAGVRPLRVLDAAAPAFAVGEGISRLGCFCAGCCYGIPWDGPWAVVFPPRSFAFIDQVRNGVTDAIVGHSTPVHPVQLYGAVLMGGLAIALIRRFHRPHAVGEIFFTLLIAYGTYRLGIAPLRTEALASMKVFSAAFILTGVIGCWWCASSRVASRTPSAPSIP